MTMAVTLFTACSVTSPQTTDTAGNTRMSDQVNNRQFSFTAQTALPLRSNTMQLTSDYGLKVSGDSVIVDLPYFGRAFSAPMNMTGGGYRFVSTRNQYTVKARKNGGWDINIKPSDAPEVRDMNLTVFSTGAASLRVTSNNRDPISFNGIVSVK